MFIIREDTQVQFGQFPQIQKEGKRDEATRHEPGRSVQPFPCIAYGDKKTASRVCARVVEAEIVAPFSNPFSFPPCHHLNLLLPLPLWQHLSRVIHDTISTRIGTEIEIEIGARHAAKPRPCCTRSNAVSGLEMLDRRLPLPWLQARRIRAGTHRRLQIVASRRPMGSVPAYPRVHLIPPSPALTVCLAFAAPVSAESHHTTTLLTSGTRGPRR